MQSPNPHHHRPSAIQRLYTWWGSSRRHWARLEDIDQVHPDDISVMAAEVGVSSDEFLRTARQPNGLLRLLNQRLAALGLDPDDIRKLSPLLLGELRRTCAMCAEKERWEVWLRTPILPVGTATVRMPARCGTYSELLSTVFGLAGTLIESTLNKPVSHFAMPLRLFLLPQINCSSTADVP